MAHRTVPPKVAKFRKHTATISAINCIVAIPTLMYWVFGEPTIWRAISLVIGCIAFALAFILAMTEMVLSGKYPHPIDEDRWVANIQQAIPGATLGTVLTDGKRPMYVIQTHRYVRIVDGQPNTIEFTAERDPDEVGF